MHELHIESGASEISIGACLLQAQDDDTRCPIAFISHTFSGASKHSKTIEKNVFVFLSILHFANENPSY